VAAAAGVAAAHHLHLLLLPQCRRHQNPHPHQSHTGPRLHPPLHHHPQMELQLLVGVAQGVPGRQVAAAAHQAAALGAARQPELLLQLWRPAAAAVPAGPVQPSSWLPQPPSAAAAEPGLLGAAGQCRWPLCHQQACLLPSWLPP
jgi:hypothetical protein